MPTTSARTFPARVTLPDGTVVDPAAVFVDTIPDGRRVRVYALRTDAPYGAPVEESKRGSVVLVYDGEVVPESAARQGIRYTSDAGAVTVARGQGCGCSHPLKRFRPPEEA